MDLWSIPKEVTIIDENVFFGDVKSFLENIETLDLSMEELCDKIKNGEINFHEEGQMIKELDLMHLFF